jgi:mannosyltransferase
MEQALSEQFDIILGNSNKRFSGVTSTMLQVMAVQQRNANIAVLGKHHIPTGTPVVGFWKLAWICRRPLSNGRYRIFHARRNDEMIQGVFLKYIFRSKLKLIFTSTAQRPKSWITRWLMARMDGVLTTCSAAQAFMESPVDRVIPHGIDVTRMKNEVSSVPIVLPDLKKVGIFGRVRQQKGVDLFVDSMIQVLPDFPGWMGVVVGQVTEGQSAFANTLKKKINEAGLSDRLVFTGEQPFDGIPNLYRSMDIVASLSVNEGFGLTVLEAMSVSKPVIATKAGAWPDIIEHGHDGFLIDIGSEAQLIKSLNMLMSSEVVRKAVGQNAEEKVLQHYAIEREAAALLSYYREVQNNPA